MSGKYFTVIIIPVNSWALCIWQPVTRPMSWEAGTGFLMPNKDGFTEIFMTVILFSSYLWAPAIWASTGAAFLGAAIALTTPTSVFGEDLGLISASCTFSPSRVVSLAVLLQSTPMLTGHHTLIWLRVSGLLMSMCLNDCQRRALCLSCPSQVPLWLQLCKQRAAAATSFLLHAERNMSVTHSQHPGWGRTAWLLWNNEYL